MTRVLVVESDTDRQEDISQALRRSEFEVQVARSAREASKAIAEDDPAAIVLEALLSDQSGFAMCKTLRETPATRDLPVLMVTPSDADMDRILAFESGADDVVPRPFYARELALRVHALLRRTSRNRRGPGPGDAALQVGPVQLDPVRQSVDVRGESVTLTEKELAILALLMRRPGRVFSREEILEKVWGDRRHRTPRVVDTHVKGIRRKLGSCGGLLESLRGVGYRISDRASA